MKTLEKNHTRKGLLRATNLAFAPPAIFAFASRKTAHFPSIAKSGNIFMGQTGTRLGLGAIAHDLSRIFASNS